VSAAQVCRSPGFEPRTMATAGSTGWATTGKVIPITNGRTTAKGFEICSGCKVNYEHDPAPSFDSPALSAGTNALLCSTMAAQRAYRA
jgi:hypothetical protein